MVVSFFLDVLPCSVDIPIHGSFQFLCGFYFVPDRQQTVQEKWHG